jgi:hypothetical protein
VGALKETETGMHESNAERFRSLARVLALGARWRWRLPCRRSDVAEAEADLHWDASLPERRRTSARQQESAAMVIESHAVTLASVPLPGSLGFATP